MDHAFRKDYMDRMKRRYAKARTRAQKGALIDETEAMCGLSRKFVIRLLTVPIATAPIAAAPQVIRRNPGKPSSTFGWRWAKCARFISTPSWTRPFGTTVRRKHRFRNPSPTNCAA